MTESTTKTSISAAYQSLPEHIRDWISSDTVTFSISETNSRLGLKEWRRRIIPELVLRLIVQDLDPVDFINEISRGLQISFQTAKSIAEEIENKVLKPIETELRRDVGVDVKLIYFGKPQAGTSTMEQKTIIPPAQPTFTARTTPAAPPAPTAPLGQTSIQKSFKEFLEPSLALKTATPKIDLQSLETPSSPFILHQETEVPPSSKPTFNARPDFNARIQNYSLPAGEEKKSSSKPISIRLETPESFDGARDGQNRRVVHYSGPRTPLTNIGTPKNSANQNKIDLRKFEKLNDNTVDLRSTTNNKPLTTNNNG